MIKTRYPIKIEIDDKSFEIVVPALMTSTQKDEISAVRDKHLNDYEKRDAVQLELNEANETFEINKHILDHGKIVEKAKTMFEQKTLNKKIFELKRELAQIDKTIPDLSKLTEELCEKRFEVAVTGSDKSALKEYLAETGVSYQLLFSEFNEKVEEAKEKK
ncbi:hypothetical protein [Sulfurimonas sp.]